MTADGEDRPGASEPEGGDPACWLDQVCPACGRLTERLPSGRCAACGEPWDAESTDVADTRDG